MNWRNNKLSIQTKKIKIASFTLMSIVSKFIYIDYEIQTFCDL